MSCPRCGAVLLESRDARESHLCLICGFRRYSEPPMYVDESELVAHYRAEIRFENMVTERRFTPAHTRNDWQTDFKR